ncbi:MAG TPA: SpoIIE family protein phosphatase [Ilumatobacteraceae bacterium]|nr:SpoIIE family protein phosphatase [Ilumatobacteraceae bacterium]
MGHVAASGPQRRSRLRARLSIVSAVYLLLFIVSSVLAGLTVRSWNESVDERGTLRVMRDDVNALRLALGDQESGVIGHVSSGNGEFLERYRDGIVRETSALERLEPKADLVADAADDLDHVRATARSWRADAAEPQIDRRQRGTDVDPELVELGRVRFDEVRAALGDLAADVNAGVGDAEDRVSSVGRTAVTGMLTAFGAALACTVLAIWLFRRWVTKPLAEISGAARAITGGQLAAMPTFDTTEFGDVADAIDSMQRSLVDERDRAIRAYEGLEQSAVLALQVRSELAEERAVTPEGWSLATRLRAAHGFVAGDCYETGLIDQYTMYIVVIDVTGHGAKAALSALKAKAQLRSALRTGLSPGSALGWLAQERHDDAVDDFVTAFIAVVDVASGECRWANAGHPPALLVTDGSAHELPHTGPLIGPFDAPWSTETVAIPHGGVVVVYTDGLTEARGEDGSRLGEVRLHERLETIVGEHIGPDEIVESLIRMVDEFQVGTPTDDVTIVALARSAGTGRVPDEVAGDTEAERRTTDRRRQVRSTLG